MMASWWRGLRRRKRWSFLWMMLGSSRSFLSFQPASQGRTVNALSNHPCLVAGRQRRASYGWTKTALFVERRAPPTIRRSTTASSSTAETTTNTQHTCHVCQQVFDSRNALFRHLRSSSHCNGKGGAEETKEEQQPDTESIACLIGYLPLLEEEIVPSSSTAVMDKPQTKIINNTRTIQHEQIMNRLETSLQQAWNEFHHEQTSSLEIVTRTCSSLARQEIAFQEDAAAAGDVVVLTVKALPSIAIPQEKDTNEQKQETERRHRDDVWNNVLVNMMQQQDDDDPFVRLIDVQRLQGHVRSNKSKRKKPLHAEQGCTQRCYHYLLPLSWLPDAAEIENWWQATIETPTNDDNPAKAGRRPHQPVHQNGPPPSSLQRFKGALKGAESKKRMIHNKTDDSDTTTFRGNGRFGGLGTRPSKAWHNFANPQLPGDATSPNTASVWRVVDRARVIDFRHDGNEWHAIVELKGDDFLQEQLRRIVASCVAMTHGWLPADFLVQATRTDLLLETPLAPPGRLYLSSLRFHFEELRSGGRPSLFLGNDSASGTGRRSSSSGTDATDTSRQWIRSSLLERKRNGPGSTAEEKAWLLDLKTTTCPRICETLSHSNPSFLIQRPIIPMPVPAVYDRVLAELRHIVATKAWPGTSKSRASVLHPKPHSSPSMGASGSFTIVNPNAAETNWDALPIGNEKFPSLVSAVFRLEEQLAAEDDIDHLLPSGEHPIVHGSKQSVSTHCAINCNAQFTPHVDRGRGEGQSLSTIVGLGDFMGGELMVEGTVRDIQYKPLRFNGWKQRHWTRPFAGERFSLVWFTPETKAQRAESHESTK